MVHTLPSVSRSLRKCTGHLLGQSSAGACLQPVSHSRARGALLHRPRTVHLPFHQPMWPRKTRRPHRYRVTLASMLSPKRWDARSLTPSWEQFIYRATCRSTPPRHCSPRQAQLPRSEACTSCTPMGAAPNTSGRLETARTQPCWVFLEPRTTGRCGASGCLTWNPWSFV
jgi:hypothetical protein